MLIQASKESAVSLDASWSLVLGSDYQEFIVQTPAQIIGMERQTGSSGDVEWLCVNVCTGGSE